MKLTKPKNCISDLETSKHLNSNILIVVRHLVFKTIMLFHLDNKAPNSNGHEYHSNLLPHYRKVYE